MEIEPREHPLRAWLLRTETTKDELAKSVANKGAHASSKYLEHIANGNYEPGWHLCVVLEKVTGIDARELKTYPYKRSKRAA